MSSAELHLATLAGDIGDMIDQAAFHAEGWKDVIAAFAAAAPGGKAVFQAVDMDGATAVPLTTAGWSDELTSAYAEYYNVINPWMPVMLAAPAMRPVFSECSLPASHFANSEFYVDWLARAGGADGSTGMRVAERNGRFGFLTFNYELRFADQANAIYEPLLRAIGPRLRRALDINCSTRPAFVGGQLLNAFVEPAFLLGSNLQIYGTNAGADALLRDGKLLRSSTRDSLEVRHTAFRDAIIKAAQRACAVRMLPGPSAATPAIVTDSGVFSIVTLTVDSKFMGASVLSPLMFPRRLALVTIRECSASYDREEFLLVLREKFGLTPAEARLAAALDGSERLSDIAERFNVKMSTARIQLRSVFRKMDVSRRL